MVIKIKIPHFTKVIQNNEQTNNKITTLKFKITAARNRLQSLWNVKGHTDTEILNAGIKLDLLINEYQSLATETADQQKFEK